MTYDDQWRMLCDVVMGVLITAAANVLLLRHLCAPHVNIMARHYIDVAYGVA